ncbi:MAG: triose-phosphate isomerase [Alphaproteobacteria bacterium]|nr:triose-phosphate isomerase [Alphaproteobacteria bacterium]
MEEKNPLIVGNWKMNGLLSEGQSWINFLSNHLPEGFLTSDLVVCPPNTLLFLFNDLIHKKTSHQKFIKLGAQNCHDQEYGAFTGEISPLMLKDIGCSYVILGHSERRYYFAETNTLICSKVRTALKAGLKVILCIGETKKEKDEGKTLSVLQNQLEQSIPSDTNQIKNLVIAYEPVWAIGTGKIPTLDDIQMVHDYIESLIAIRIGKHHQNRILYGGSVQPNNAKQIFDIKNVGGLLVGGASLNAKIFLQIIEACYDK